MATSWLETLRSEPFVRRVSEGSTRSRAAALAGGTALLFGTWAVVEDDSRPLPRWEEPVFRALNGRADRWQPAVWPVMQLGNFWVWAAAAPAGAAVLRRWEPPVPWTSSVLSAWALAKVVKRRAGRGRPGDRLERVAVREGGIHGSGFVSGHVAVASALATAVLPYLPPGPARAVPFLLVAEVAAARLYVGAHLPLDVVGGAGLGVLCGLASSVATGTPRRP